MSIPLAWENQFRKVGLGSETQHFRERSERLELDFAYVLLNLIARCLWIYGKATSGLMSLDLAGFNPFTLT